MAQAVVSETGKVVPVSQSSRIRVRTYVQIIVAMPAIA
jgi:hypothetical protein